MTDYQERARRELARCADIARGMHDVSPIVRVEWNLRGLTAGKAYPAQHERCRISGNARCYLIRLNADIAQREGEAFDATVAHEFAHVVIFALRDRFFETHGYYPRGPHWSAHGRAWSSVMHEFGLPARRCHAYKVERAIERRSYVYRCQCSDDVRLSIIRHRKIESGRANYRCRRCKVRLVFDHAA